MSASDTYFRKYLLQFKKPAGTSRGVMHKKETYFIIKQGHDGKFGIGECGIFRGLSVDDRVNYEDMLQQVCNKWDEYKDHPEYLNDWPSIQFGLEQCVRSFESEGSAFTLFDTSFVKGNEGIWTNGLIWMGDPEYMRQQIETKLREKFRCIKLKIGALELEEEIELIQFIRESNGGKAIEIRLDANGAFSPRKAAKVLEKLSEYNIHSIEQPIKAGNLFAMKELCENSPIPIALDEELIGVHNRNAKDDLLSRLKPAYIILKPSLLGGFAACEEWIDIAREHQIKWWATSALESNIGLNAIAQWVAQFNLKLPQGLGTGGLFTNNFISPLVMNGEELRTDKHGEWDVRRLFR
ncbi:MAG TPA: o-succinylbenzoate synthase [Flavobacteriales bacterium]|jgi:o-succinylbenzoate synthase|nr:o-succinylbenzoate synthase [Salibacteraceae bacterium]HAS35779.1 o-succinylbenzoate synthase [Flavobacteriales bacterium]